MVHFHARPSSLRWSITPYGQAGMQYPQPLQTSSCTTTVPNSVRNSAPVGQTSRQAACVQCLHTSEDINQRNSIRPSAPAVVPGGAVDGMPRSTTGACRPVTPGSCAPSGFGCSMEACSMNATCRQVLAPSEPVLSYDRPRKSMPSSGTLFHSLQATSQALQPMQTVVSVKNPSRGGWSG